MFFWEKSDNLSWIWWLFWDMKLLLWSTLQPHELTKSKYQSPGLYKGKPGLFCSALVWWAAPLCTLGKPYHPIQCHVLHFYHSRAFSWTVTLFIVNKGVCVVFILKFIAVYLPRETFPPIVIKALQRHNIFSLPPSCNLCCNCKNRNFDLSIYLSAPNICVWHTDVSLPTLI